MPTHHRGRERERHALDAYIKLMRAAMSLTERLQATMSAAGLTGGQFGVLEALYHLGPMFQRDLAAKLLMTAGNMTMLVNHLERDGLVGRERDDNDRRCIHVSLTPRGRRLIASVFPAHAARVLKEFSVLTLEEQAALGRLCRTVGLGQRE